MKTSMKRLLFTLTLLAIVWYGTACSEPAPADLPIEKKGSPMGFEITKVYKEHFPALRLIGKRYTNANRGPDGFARFWREWTAPGGRFEELKKLGPSDAVEYGYIGLMTTGPGNEGTDDFTYWIGMFFPAGTAVPEGFDYLDLPENDIGVAWIYGDDRTGEIFGQASHCASFYALRDNGMGRLNTNAGGEGAIVYFERYAARFAARDERGKVILDYGFYLE